MAKLTLAGLLSCLFLPLMLRAQVPPPHEAQGTWSRQITTEVRMQYLVVLPRNHTANHAPWPVILYLHGAGDRGQDLALVRRTEAVKQAETRADFPFILVAPQVADPDQSWLYPGNRTAAIGILDEVLRTYHGDSARVYLTGISMGGWGAWFFAYTYPDRFAAVAPLCGSDADLRWAPRIARTPVWAFHGTNDNVAPILDTERMVAELQKLGADPKYTPVVGGDHDIAKAVYSRDDLYRWFLEHKLQAPR